MRENWTYKKLGEVGNVVTGSTPSTKDAANYASPDYCFVKPSDLPSSGIAVIDDSEFHISAKAFSSARQLPKGSVVVSCIGIIGKVGILNKDACTNQQINAIIPNDTIMPKCLAYIICYNKSELEQIANAPVVPIINKGKFSNFLIPVPSLSEQQSIVAELDKINELISLKKAQLDDLDALAQSIFYDMFGDPIENEKGWEVKKLGEECVDMKYGTSSPACENGRYKYLRMGNITLDGHLDLSELKSIDISDNEAEKCIVKYGDILFNRTNSYELIGKTCMFDLLEPMVIAGYIIRVRLSNNLQPRYISKMFNLPSFKKLLRGKAKGAVNQANINSKELASIPIPLPPLALQQDFAKRIELIEQQKAQISSTIKDLETLLASRMQYWFD